jgi:Na+/H+ antiporter NhaC
VALLLVTAASATPAEPTLGIALDGAALSNTALHVIVQVDGVEGELPVAIAVDGRSLDRRTLGNGEHPLALAAAHLSAGRHELEVTAGALSSASEIYVLPSWLSLLPPLIAIGLAIAFKDVLLALFLGVFSGALCLFGWNPLTALARTVDHFVVPAVIDRGQASILIFTLMLGGMVGLVSKSGGTKGIVASMSRFATTATRGQVATWIMGVVVFFDDYSNALIVGSTMRPLSDRLRISREKLAYIVDSTSAPVASVVPFSSWIGFEVGLIAAALTALNLPYNAYATFLASIPFRFYPIFALVLGFTVAFTGRDFGPMHKAEERTRSTGKLMDDDAVPLADYGEERLAPPDGAPLRAINALLPILTIVVVTLAGLYLTGRSGLDRADYPGLGDWAREIMSNADSYRALLWASLGGVVVGALLPLAQRILSLRQTMEAMVEGFKSMLLALVVLTLAWSIGAVCSELHTADFLVRLIGGTISHHWIPALVFFLSAAIAFATGSSWGTLSILMPLVIPISHSVATHGGLEVGTPPYTTILVGTISSVLAGSVWGDHCSPISDTTILSSTATGCDHIAHVRTQMPYALGAGFLGVIVGDIPTAFGMSPWLSLLIGTVVIVAVVRWLGKPDSASAQAPATS